MFRTSGRRRQCRNNWGVVRAPDCGAPQTISHRLTMGTCSGMRGDSRTNEFHPPAPVNSPTD